MIHQAKQVFPAMAIILALPSASVAQEIGEASFMANCAVCHGANGTGNGPILDFLKNAPSDLTGLSEEMAGSFRLSAYMKSLLTLIRTAVTEPAKCQSGAIDLTLILSLKKGNMGVAVAECLRRNLAYLNWSST